jgi:DHA1 family bicyclomycin/chloramphenicol resistance-like MFS transporter
MSGFLGRLRGLPLSFPEFVTMMAASMSLYAMAIDTMLPALPAMGREFAVADDNQLQYIITLYMAGGGLGQMLYGPLADRFGRRPILLLGFGLYFLAALLAALASSIDMLLGIRLLQGLVAAAVSVIPRSIIRDRHAGAQMAKVMSITFIIFLIVPVIAPTVGQALLLIMPWRGIFLVLSGMACLVTGWIALRLPETLDPAHRRSLHPVHMLKAAWHVVTERTSIYYSLGSTFLIGGLMAYISTLPQIFSVAFHLPKLMPLIFALCAGTMAVTSFFNAKIVERAGMRRVSHCALLGYIAFNGVHAAIAVTGHETLFTFALLQAGTMGCFGLAASNFNAIAMFHMGRMAGSASSVQGLISMVGGALIGTVIGHQWNGQVTFLPTGGLVCGIVVLGLILLAEKGKLFTDPPHEEIAAVDLDLSAGH